MKTDPKHEKKEISPVARRMSLRNLMEKHPGRPDAKVGWIRDSLPDSDSTVLMRLRDDEYPVWVGFHDGEQWRSADASTVSGPVLGWMHLEDAAILLDTSRKL